jgi:cyclophilin family peptidyl-prolyl cis-trans isomerase/HEAT repeat protein
MSRFLLPVLALLGAGVAFAQTAQPSLRLRMLAAEDARDASPAAIAPILEGLKTDDAEIRRVAVRALGRFERPSLTEIIVPVLADREASVRSEAANALAQGVSAGAGPLQITGVFGTLRDRLAVETHPLVRGALAGAIGRLPRTTEQEFRGAELILLDAAFPADRRGVRTPASPAVLFGALRGFEALVRRAPEGAQLLESTLTLLGEVARTAGTPAKAGQAATMDLASGPLRRAAMQVIRASGWTDQRLLLDLMDDPDEGVRRRVAGMLGAAQPLSADDVARLAVRDARPTDRDPAAAAERWRELDRRSQAKFDSDTSPMVRSEWLRAYAARRDGVECARLARFIDDRDPKVQQLGLSSTSARCKPDPDARERIVEVAAQWREGPSWHRRAHAMHALAVLDPGLARPRVIEELSSPNPWLRKYAALSAEPILTVAGAAERRDEALIAAVGALAADPEEFVAAQAMATLKTTMGRAARDHYLRALRRDGDEVILETVGGLVRDVPAPGADPEAATAAIVTLDRVTKQKRETSRDARVALLGAVEKLGTRDHAAPMEPYLKDFDVEVARVAARAIKALTGAAEAPAIAPVPLPRLPLPSDEDLRRMDAVRVVLTIRGRGEIVVRLRPDEAPLNAFRFLRLAESGYYTGLTIHRIVPNFVVQGGSPAANEYSGDGPFSRDEVGLLSNLRGSVGLSTRGRDTGDAQFYVNLVDNVRLDHTYTVFGQVESGMDAVDALIEGDVIEKVTIR